VGVSGVRREYAVRRGERTWANQRLVGTRPKPGGIPVFRHL